MEFKELLRLIAPVITIIIGIFIKLSNKEQLQSLKKYWLFFVITGVALFLFRIFKYLK
jgi:uncharacterized membrane protein